MKIPGNSPSFHPLDPHFTTIPPLRPPRALRADSRTPTNSPRPPRPPCFSKQAATRGWPRLR